MSLSHDNTTDPRRSASVVLPVVRPRVDLFTREDALLVLAELPGVSANDLSIQLDAQVLRIEAVGRAGPESAKAGAPTPSPVRYERAVSLRTQVDGDRIRAALRNGLLELHLPRAASAQRRRIPIDA